MKKLTVLMILAGMLLWLAPAVPAQQHEFGVNKHFVDDDEDFIPWHAVPLGQPLTSATIGPRPLPPSPGPPGPGPWPLPPSPGPPPLMRR